VSCDELHRKWARLKTIIRRYVVRYAANVGESQQNQGEMVAQVLGFCQYLAVLCVLLDMGRAGTKRFKTA
jgi:hypothetical protein